MNYVSVDGRILPAGQPALHVNNRGYRYGDGLFETMKVKANRIIFENWHFERLLTGLKLIDLELPSTINRERLTKEVLALCELNGCSGLARVRLSVNRGDGNISDPDQPQYVIECLGIKEEWNEYGILIDVYPFARKSCDRFCNLKSANYLSYVMAARYAKSNNLDEALVLNVHERIAEASVANVFIVKGERLFTPSLDEGCVAGVLRRWVLENYQVIETSLSLEDILSADEVFLTNAISGIRWVKQCRDKLYKGEMASAIYERLLA